MGAAFALPARGRCLRRRRKRRVLPVCSESASSGPVVHQFSPLGRLRAMERNTAVMGYALRTAQRQDSIAVTFSAGDVVIMQYRYTGVRQRARGCGWGTESSSPTVVGALPRRWPHTAPPSPPACRRPSTACPLSVGNDPTSRSA